MRRALLFLWRHGVIADKFTRAAWAMSGGLYALHALLLLVGPLREGVSEWWRLLGLVFFPASVWFVHFVLTDKLPEQAP